MPVMILGDALCAAVAKAQDAGHTDDAIIAAIAALPEPVDPLLEMAREAAARWWDRVKEADAAAIAVNYRAGEYDNTQDAELEVALIALRMAKEQGLPE